MYDHTVGLPNHPAADGCGEFPASLQAFGAEEDSSGIAVQAVTDRRAETGSSIQPAEITSLPFLSQIPPEPFIHGKIAWSGFLGEDSCGLYDDQHILILVKDRILAQQGLQPAKSALIFIRSFLLTG